ncbi:MAG: Tripartite tricarboxylate transporter TctA family protein [Microvirga sp.]|jgi:TctA family transporter|nr:Tripartite tricarboxylate transporter TctA family protein [Microvirga sp.]
MDLLGNLSLGMATALQPVNLLFCFIGAFLGTAVGVLPGVGPLATIAMLLPITFKVSPEASVIMLAGIYYGAQYGGSTTAILINLPGEASSAVTAIDGYQMARQGKAGTALGVAAIGSFLAGTLSTVLIAGFAAPLTSIALTFGPVEYFSLMTLGLIASITLANGSLLKAIGMILVGLLLGTIGTDIYSGSARFTLGLDGLADGLPIVAFGAGIYGISEILLGLEHESKTRIVIAKVSNLLPKFSELKQAAGPIARGSLLGSLLGVLPGGGPLLASFGSYAMEKRLSRTPEQFGKGAIEAVAGPEAANNAGAQTSFVPMLALGIPSNPIMALMMGALIIQGVTPGPDFMTSHPTIFWGVIASMWVGNLMLLVLNLPLISLWVKLLTVPQRALFPAIVAFASVGVYSVNTNGFDLIVMVLFGFVGYLMTKLDCEPAPLLLGFVLGPMIEEYFRRAMAISQGNALVFVQKPISAVMLGLAVIMFLVALLPAISRRRAAIFVEDEA